MFDKYTFHQGTWEDLMLSPTGRAQHLLTRLVAHKEHWSHHWESTVLVAPLSQRPEEDGHQTDESFRCIDLIQINIFEEEILKKCLKNVQAITLDKWLVAYWRSPTSNDDRISLA